MYLVFGEEFLLLWIKDLMFNNRKKLEPEDYVAVNELRHALDMNLLKINEMIIKAASTQIYKTDDLEILNQYYTPGKQDFIDKELGKFVDDEKSKLIDVNLEIEEQILNIKDKIEKLKILLGE